MLRYAVQECSEELFQDGKINSTGNEEKWHHLESHLGNVCGNDISPFIS
jgi:hypothetical protein